MHPCSYQQPSFTVLHIFALKQRNIEILLFFPSVVEVLFWRCGLPNTGEALWNMCTTCNLVERTMGMVVILAKYQNFFKRNVLNICSLYKIILYKIIKSHHENVLE